VEVNETMLESGHMLKDITLPENTLVMMVCRNGEYFVPQGKTELLLGDKLLTDMLGANRAGVLPLMGEPLGGPRGAWNKVLHGLQRPWKAASLKKHPER